MLKYHLLFSTTLVLYIWIETSFACPSECTCKWKNGKQTVNCNEQNMFVIPDGLDPETQVLEFSDNNMSILVPELFLRKELINLQRIYLARCKIKIINEKTFSGLTNLVDLDLSGNLIEIVPTSSFIDCPSLMRLTLSSNPIKVLKKFSFNHLSYLNTLELNNCEIHDVEEGAFQGLQSLEWLLLNENKLKTVKGINTLPQNLKGVELGGNMWECDCHIKDFHFWLKNFNIPVAVEPVCSGPPRLVNRVIKSIPITELACLPDVSPTTFYLELAEGKNVSLLCHVHAIPEASVSWWFQGQILQNNSVVAPGIHLIYFIEEGAENKRSELFIHNANSEDNGTFICNAENAAGTSQSNFTIKIIIKEDPIVIIVSFPFEYLLAVAIGVGILGLVIIMVIIISIFRYRKKRSQRDEKTNKDVGMNPTIAKSVVVQEEVNTLSNLPVKSNLKLNDEAMTLYNAHHSDDVLCGGTTPVVGANQATSPTSLRRYQLEQNPDLINGTESVGCRWKKGGGDVEDAGRLRKTTENEQASPIIRHEVAHFSCLRTNSDIYNDVRWNIGCIVDADGYPIDYGLPKLQNRTENFYRTLPINRMKRQQQIRGGGGKLNYSQDAEFLHNRNYDYYQNDIRYTADGYPVFEENYKTDAGAPSSLPCCSIQWPACVPANLHTINHNFEYNPTNSVRITRRCVSAQTDNQVEEETKIDPHTINSQNEPVNEILTESPDEGYEGEPSVV